MSDGTAVVCPYCTQPARLVDSARIYGRSYGLVWDCRPCDAYVGCHRGTDRPLGTLANRQLRQLRRRTHEVFDQLWTSQGVRRSRAYQWMQQVMGLTAEEAHIGQFRVEQCHQLLGHLTRIGNLARASASTQ